MFARAVVALFFLAAAFLTGFMAPRVALEELLGIRSARGPGDFASLTTSPDRPMPCSHVCPKEVLTSATRFAFHPYTSRGFGEHVTMIHPSFLDAWALFAKRKRMRLLDIGTGSGHALVDIQSRFPDSYLVGTNDLRYEAGKAEVTQALSDADLLASAAAFNVPVHCDCFGRPILPRLAFLDIMSPHFRGGGLFSNRSFHFVTSLLALNGPSKTLEHHYLPRVIGLLALEGLAVMHVGDAAFGAEDMKVRARVPNAICSDTSIVKTIGKEGTIDAFTGKDGDRQVSFALCLKQAEVVIPQVYYFVTLVAKVCPAGFVGRDCVLPEGAPRLGMQLLKRNVHVWPVTHWSLDNFLINLALYRNPSAV
jgi:hypothetical protein